jgi:hypothetical protein
MEGLDLKPHFGKFEIAVEIFHIPLPIEREAWEYFMLPELSRSG